MPTAQDPTERVKKARTQKGKRCLERRSAKLIENTKRTLFIRGSHTNEIVSGCLKDLHQLKLANSIMMKGRNRFNMFEDETDIEKLATKYDASLFAFGSNSKKRPNNLILGRMFDLHILDMFEFEIGDFLPMRSFKIAKCTVGAKPCLLFCGDEFQQNSVYIRVKSMLTDFFRGQQVENLRLQGLELAISFSFLRGSIHMRTYKICLKKSGMKTPRIELEEMGPRLRLTLRRSHMASDDLLKTAMRQPKQLKAKPTKNVSHDVFGTRLARLHVGKQNLQQLQTRKLKGLKKEFGRKRKLDGDRET